MPHSGALYENFQETLSRCRINDSPSLYVSTRLYVGTHEGLFNAWYVHYSRFPFRTRPGKILVSKEFVDFFAPDDLQVIIAHELGHRDKEFGLPPSLLFYAWDGVSGENEKKRREFDADLFAAKCFDRERVIKTLLASVDLFERDPHDPIFTKEQRKYLLGLRSSGALKVVEKGFFARIAVLGRRPN